MVGGQRLGTRRVALYRSRQTRHAGSIGDQVGRRDPGCDLGGCAAVAFTAQASGRTKCIIARSLGVDAIRAATDDRANGFCSRHGAGGVVAPSTDTDGCAECNCADCLRTACGPFRRRT